MSTRHIVIEPDLGPATLMTRDKAVTGVYFSRPVRRPAPEIFGPPADVSADTPLGARRRGSRLAYLWNARRDW